MERVKLDAWEILALEALVKREQDDEGGTMDKESIVVLAQKLERADEITVKHRKKGFGYIATR